MSCLSFRNVVKSLVLSALLLSGHRLCTASASAAEIDFSTYAAVAFSPSTGKYGYAWDQPTRGYAERIALSYCKAEDAKIVGWVQGGWLVLAIGEDNAYGVGWEYGNGAVNTDAFNRARAECHQHGQRVKTYVCLCSGDIDPKVYQVQSSK